MLRLFTKLIKHYFALWKCVQYLVKLKGSLNLIQIMKCTDLDKFHIDYKITPHYISLL